MVKIGLIQMRCEKGSIDANLVEMSRYIEEAERLGVDIIGFPEANVTGYNEPERFPQAILSLDGPEVAAIVKTTEGKNLTVLAGIIEENPVRHPFTTHIVARNGKLIGYYRKINMAEDDNEWFSPGSEIKAFNHDSLTFGIAICADIKKEEIFTECARQRARIVFELAAPGLYGEQATRDWQAGYKWWEEECKKYLKDYAKKYGIWIAVATQAGRTSDEDFPGGGYVFSPEGKRVFSTKDWYPCSLYLEIDLDSHQVTELAEKQDVLFQFS